MLPTKNNRDFTAMNPASRVRVTLSTIALCAFATLITQSLENDITGLSPIYLQAGVIAATALCFGWSYLLLAVAVSVGVAAGFETYTLGQSLEWHSVFAQAAAFGLLGLLGLRYTGQFKDRQGLVHSNLSGIIIIEVFIAAAGSAALLSINTLFLGSFSLEQFVSNTLTLLFALAAGVLLLARTSTIILTLDGTLFRVSRRSLTVGALGFCFALWFNQGENNASERAIHQHFADHNSELTRALRERTVAHSEILQSLARLIEFSPDLSQQAFDQFVALTLEDESDIFALSYNPVITAQTRAAFEAQMQRLLNNPEFSIRERVGGTVQRSANHGLYVPVGIISPLASNAKAIGFDIYSNEVRRAAIESAFASGKAAVTAPIKLVQETQERMAVLMLEPVWGGIDTGQAPAISGFSVAVLKVDELFNLNLQELLRAGLNYKLSDNKSTDPAFDFVKVDSVADAMTRYQYSANVAVADRVWALEVQPTRQYLMTSSVAPSQLSAAFIFMLAGLVKMLTQRASLRHEEIKARVSEQTQTIREKMDLADTALAELRQRKEQQERLFAIIGHELRTPVSAIKMMLDMHQGEYDIGPHSQEIRSTVEHLLSVLDDMRYSIRPEEVQLVERVLTVPEHVIERTVSANRPQLSKAGIEVSLKNCNLMPHAYLMSEKVLRQILHNLLRNATLHSGATHLEICSKLEVLTGAANRLTVRVQDNGRGIAQEHLARLFEPFYRGNTEVDGTGLGLSICRQLARDHGGDLTYCASELGGACFELTLEVNDEESGLNADPAPSLAQHNSVPDRLDGIRVLYAEDNPTIQLLTKTILVKLGAEVSVASNGEEALALAEENQFDLVVTDIFMPKLDGYGLTVALRTRGFDGCIVGVTAATVGEESDKLLQVGATAIIPKPLDVHKLLSVCDAAQTLSMKNQAEGGVGKTEPGANLAESDEA